eukprot:TRINITY_DN3161_c0_g3_i3.p2 TRINITY_DN3161_c0_g3~~TRINITY_DN3161_c0_g3_i3.p2  ORF type:complete len:342 (+),score=64.14 TRINITY_DN3161_c0_g3_i3:330-1355(+)
MAAAGVFGCHARCFRHVVAVLLAWMPLRCGGAATDLGAKSTGARRAAAALLRAEGGMEVDAHAADDACSKYPGRRVVLVAVDTDYVRFFENWLLHAGKVLGDHEQVVVLAEDASALAALKTLRDGASKGRLRGFELLSAEASAGPSLLEQSSTPWGTRGYNELMHRRPGHFLRFLQQGCAVLMADVDAVWLKNPFDEIAAAGEQDLYFVDDGFRVGEDDPLPLWTPGTRDCKATKVNFCGGFVYARASSAGVAFTQRWSSECLTSKYTNDGNQRVMNDVLCEHMQDVRFAVLPAERFPIGTSARKAQDPTIVHANWIVTHEDKMAFLKELGLWNVSEILEA